MPEKEGVNYKVGDLVKKAHEKNDKTRYIYLGEVRPEHLIKELWQSLGLVSMGHEKEVGWFAEYPIKPMFVSFESVLPIYIWFLNTFEKAEEPQAI